MTVVGQLPSPFKEQSSGRGVSTVGQAKNPPLIHGRGRRSKHSKRPSA
jgi:hypothetical protein